MGKSQRDKGARVERELVNDLKGRGIVAERVSLSGGAGGSYTGDIIIDKSVKVEVKARKNGEGFAVIEQWLGDNDLLFLKRNNRPPMVVMEWEMFTKLMRDLICQSLRK